MYIHTCSMERFDVQNICSGTNCNVRGPVEAVLVNVQMHSCVILECYIHILCVWADTRQCIIH